MINMLFTSSLKNNYRLISNLKFNHLIKRCFSVGPKRPFPRLNLFNSKLITLDLTKLSRALARNTKPHRGLHEYYIRWKGT